MLTSLFGLSLSIAPVQASAPMDVDQLECAVALPAPPDSCGGAQYVDPPGATYIPTPDGMSIVPSAASGFDVIDLDGNSITSATQSCNCTGSGSCSPVFLGGSSGCAQDDCSNCVGTRSGIYLDPYGVRFVGESDSVEQQQNLGMLDALMSIDAFRIELEDFLFSHGIADLPDIGDDPEAYEAPPGFGYVVVSLHGHHAYVPVAATVVLPAGSITAFVTQGKASCDCKEGSGCELSDPIGPGWGCKAKGCKNCSASTGVTGVSLFPGLVETALPW